MKISTEIGSIEKIVGLERAVELCGRAGFNAFDFSIFSRCLIDVKLARKLKNIGLDYGITCNQSHAPFPVRDPDIRSYLKCAIECTAEAGGEICIIHPDNYKSAKENAEMYSELLPFAKECGVKIAAENMWCWDNDKNESCFAACATIEDFKKHIDIIGDDYLVACLDLGHAEMRGSGEGAVNMIKGLGHRIKALHIHDNDRRHDSHQIPFSMDIDFDSIVKALKEIDYKGYFTLEADRFLSAYNETNVLEGVIKLKESARRLADMFEAL